MTRLEKINKLVPLFGKARQAFYPQSPRIEDKEYLDWVAAQPCAICNSPEPSDPHHVGMSGTGTKTHDWNAIPLCGMHHEEYHHYGKYAFGVKYRADISEAQAISLKTYIFYKTHLQNK